MRLIDADKLLQQIEELESRETESADSFTTPSGVRAIEFNRIKDYIDAAPVVGNIPVDSDLKDPHLFVVPGLIDRAELIFRINEILPEKISEDAEDIYAEIITSSEVRAYQMGGYKTFGDDESDKGPFNIDRKEKNHAIN